MRTRRARLAQASPERLERGLTDALVCARRLGSVRVAEAVLSALEAHARETGRQAALDAAYLRCVSHGTRGVPVRARVRSIGRLGPRPC